MPAGAFLYLKNGISEQWHARRGFFVPKKLHFWAVTSLLFIIIHHYSSLFSIIHHYSSLFIIIHHYSSLFIIIHHHYSSSLFIIIHHYIIIIHHYSSLFIIIHHYSSLFIIIIHHYSSLFIIIHHYSSLFIIIHHCSLKTLLGPRGPFGVPRRLEATLGGAWTAKVSQSVWGVVKKWGLGILVAHYRRQRRRRRRRIRCHRVQLGPPFHTRRGSGWR